MKIFLKIITIISFGFLIESCKKDKEITNSDLLNGDWNITNLEYDTQIEIPVVGTQSFTGEANDAGFWSFQYPENTCSNTLSFAVTIDNPLISAIFDSIPIDINSNGTWELSNNDNTLTITDEQTGAVSNYQILSIQENICFLEGQIQVEEMFGFSPVVDIELRLNK
ncbi:MAG: lipocalin family protein [Flavobacteriales bacterium]|nr:lipocalin family protein [Flavobacteriales bacterium]